MSSPSRPAAIGLAVLAAISIRVAAAPAALSSECEKEIRKGLDYLLAAQNREGSWGSVRRSMPFDGIFWWSPETHRSWRLATTGLACIALMDHAPRMANTASLERGIDFILANADVKRCHDWDTDHVWGWIYALDALARAERFEKLASRRDAIRPVVDRLIRNLSVYQTPSGGWGYYDFGTPKTRTPTWATSFTTASALLALREAKRSGHAVPEEMSAAALRAVERSRLPDGGNSYTVEAVPKPTPGSPWIYNVKGSLSRIQVVNLALRSWGAPLSEEEAARGLDLFFKHHRFLEIAVSRPIPHEAYYFNSGYFYLYGHAYAARLARGLSPALKDRYLPRIRAEVTRLQDADGSFSDFVMMGYDRPYGTAFALIALAE